MINDIQNLKKFKLILLSAVCSIGLSSCASLSVQSEYLEQAKTYIKGISYNLPKSIVSFQVKRKSNKITVTSPTVMHVADPRAHYQVHFNESALAEDTFDLTIKENGLLSSADITNEDQTPAIVEKAVSLLEEAKSIKFASAAVDVNPEEDYHLDIVFDPNDPEQIRYARKRLKEKSFKLQVKDIEGHPLHSRHHNSQVTQLNYQIAIENTAKQCEGSLCFRIPRAIIIEVISINDKSNNDKSNNDTSIRTRDTINIADHRSVATIDVRRAACVKKVNNFKFKDGFITQHKITKPSEILGCMSIPSSLVKAIIGLKK